MEVHMEDLKEDLKEEINMEEQQDMVKQLVVLD
jgi:hypothetical protein